MENDTKEKGGVLEYGDDVVGEGQKAAVNAYVASPEFQGAKEHYHSLDGWRERVAGVYDKWAEANNGDMPGGRDAAITSIAMCAGYEPKSDDEYGVALDAMTRVLSNGRRTGDVDGSFVSSLMPSAGKYGRRDETTGTFKRSEAFAFARDSLKKFMEGKYARERMADERMVKADIGMKEGETWEGMSHERKMEVATSGASWLQIAGFRWESIVGGMSARDFIDAGRAALGLIRGDVGAIANVSAERAVRRKEETEEDAKRKREAEDAFISKVRSAFDDVDGQYAFLEAAELMDRYPKSWDFVKYVEDAWKRRSPMRFVEGFEGTQMVVGGEREPLVIKKNELFEELAKWYVTEPDPETRAGTVAATVKMLSSVDRKFGPRGSTGLNMGTAMDLLADFGAATERVIGSVANTYVGLGEWAISKAELAKAEETIGKMLSGEEAERLSVMDANLKSAFRRIQGAAASDRYSGGGAIEESLSFMAEMYGMGPVFTGGRVAAGGVVWAAGKTAAKIAPKAEAAAKLGKYWMGFSKASPFTEKIVERMSAQRAEIARARAAWNKAESMLTQAETGSMLGEVVPAEMTADMMKAAAEARRTLAALKAKGVDPQKALALADKIADFVAHVPGAAVLGASGEDRRFSDSLNDSLLNAERYRNGKNGETEAFFGELTPEQYAEIESSVGGAHSFIHTMLLAGLLPAARGSVKAIGEGWSKMFSRASELEAMAAEYDFTTMMGITKLAFQRTAQSFGRNFAFFGAEGLNDLAAQNMRTVWEKMQLDSGFKPGTVDYVRGLPETIVGAAGEAAKISAAEGLLFGGLTGAARLTKEGRERAEEIRDSRADYAEYAMAAGGSEAPAKDLYDLLVAMRDAKAKGRKEYAAVRNEMRRKLGEGGVRLVEQLDREARNGTTESNADVEAAIRMNRSADLTKDGVAALNRLFRIKTKSVEDVDFGGAKAVKVTLDGGKSFIVAKGEPKYRDKDGNFAPNWVQEVVSNYESGTDYFGDDFAAAWDALPESSKNVARTAGDRAKNGENVVLTQDMVAALEKAIPFTRTKGVFYTAAEAARMGFPGAENIDLMDGLLVISGKKREVEPIFGDMEKTKGIIGEMLSATGKELMHEYLHMAQRLLIESTMGKEQLKAFEEEWAKRGTGGAGENFVNAMLDWYASERRSNNEDAEAADRASKGWLSKMASAANDFLFGIGQFKSDAALRRIGYEADLTAKVSEILKAAKNDGVREMKDTPETNAEVDKIVNEATAELEGTTGKGDADETGRGADEAQEKPAEGEVVPEAEGPSEKPVEGEEPRGEAPDAGLVKADEDVKAGVGKAETDVTPEMRSHYALIVEDVNGHDVPVAVAKSEDGSIREGAAVDAEGKAANWEGRRVVMLGDKLDGEAKRMVEGAVAAGGGDFAVDGQTKGWYDEKQHEEFARKPADWTKFDTREDGFDRASWTTRLAEAVDVLNSPDEFWKVALPTKDRKPITWNTKDGRTILIASDINRDVYGKEGVETHGKGGIGLHFRNHIAECGYTDGKSVLTAQEVNDWLRPCLETPVRYDGRGRSYHEIDIGYGVKMKIGTAFIKTAGGSEVETPVSITSSRMNDVNRRICKSAAEEMAKKKSGQGPVNLSTQGGASTLDQTGGSISKREMRVNGVDFTMLGETNRDFPSKGMMTRSIGPAIVKAKGGYPFKGDAGFVLPNGSEFLVVGERGMGSLVKAGLITVKERKDITNRAVEAFDMARRELYAGRVGADRRRKFVSNAEMERFVNGKDDSLVFDVGDGLRFMAHKTGVGGVNGETGKNTSWGGREDNGIRWEYYGNRPKFTKEHRERLERGERVTVGEVLNDGVLQAAYPEIFNAPIILEDRWSPSVATVTVKGVDTKSGEHKGVRVDKLPFENRKVVDRTRTSKSAAGATRDGEVIIFSRKGGATSKQLNDDIAKAVFDMIAAREGWQGRRYVEDSATGRMTYSGWFTMDDFYGKAGRSGIRARNGHAIEGIYTLFGDPKLSAEERDSVLMAAAERYVREFLKDTGRKGTRKQVDLGVKAAANAVKLALEDAGGWFARELEAEAYALRTGKDFGARDMAKYERSLIFGAEEGLAETGAQRSGKDATRRTLGFYKRNVGKAVEDAVSELFGGDEAKAAFAKVFDEAVGRRMVVERAKACLAGTRKYRSVAELNEAIAILDAGTEAERRVAAKLEAAGSDALTWHKDWERAAEHEREKSKDAMPSTTLDEALKKRGLTPDGAAAPVGGEPAEGKKRFAAKKLTGDGQVETEVAEAGGTEASDRYLDALEMLKRPMKSKLLVASAADVVRVALEREGLDGIAKGSEAYGALEEALKTSDKLLNYNRATGKPWDVQTLIREALVESGIDIASFAKGGGDYSVSGSRTPSARELYRKKYGLPRGRYDIMTLGEAKTDSRESRMRIAQREATRMKQARIRNAVGVSLAEVDAAVGMDTAGELLWMGTGEGSTRTPEELAEALYEGFVVNARKRDERARGMTIAEISSDPVLAADFGATVASFLEHAGRRLAFGRAREDAIDAANALRHRLRPSFDSALKVASGAITSLANAVQRVKTADVVAKIERLIDREAMGKRPVTVEMQAFERDIAPRIQQYWKEVKKAMHMTEKSVNEEMERLRKELGDDDWLHATGGKGSEWAEDVAEDGLSETDRKQMRLAALARYGALGERPLGEAFDAIEGAARDILTRQADFEAEYAERLADYRATKDALLSGLKAVKGGGKAKGRFASWLTSAVQFNVPDLFAKMAWEFTEDSDAHRAIDSLRRSISNAHMAEAELSAGMDVDFRSAVERIYGKSFGLVIKELLAPRADLAKFSRRGWHVPEKGVADEAEVEIDGKKVTVRLAVDRSDPRYKGVNDDAEVSVGTLIGIYLAMEQDDMRVNNVVFGKDEAYKEEVRKAIGDKGVAMAEWMRAALEGVREKLSPVAERITGMPVLAPGENYFPHHFVIPDSVQSAERYSISLFPGFLSSRKNHDYATLDETRDAFSSFQNHINQAAHYIAWADVMAKVRATFADKEVRTMYANVLGRKAFQSMYRQLYDTLSGGKRDTSKFGGWLRNFTTTTTLFYNLPLSSKQLEGIGGGWGATMGVWTWFKSLPTLWRGCSEVSDVLKTRGVEGFSEAQRHIKEAIDGVRGRNLWKFYQRNGMILTEKFDALATSSFAGAAYCDRYDWHRKMGKSEEEARQDALADVDYMVQLGQQSSRPEFHNAVQRSGSGGSFLTQFAGPKYIRLGMEIEALHRLWVERGSAKAFKNLANKVIALHVIGPTILSMINALGLTLTHNPDDDEWAKRAYKDWAKACLLGPLSGWFIAGSMISSGYDAVTHDYWKRNLGLRKTGRGGGSSSPVESKFSYLAQTTAEIARGVGKCITEDHFKNRDRKALYEATCDLFDALFPVERQVRRTIENVENWDRNVARPVRKATRRVERMWKEGSR